MFNTGREKRCEYFSLFYLIWSRSPTFKLAPAGCGSATLLVLWSNLARFGISNGGVRAGVSQGLPPPSCTNIRTVFNILITILNFLCYRWLKPDGFRSSILTSVYNAICTKGEGIVPTFILDTPQSGSLVITPTSQAQEVSHEADTCGSASVTSVAEPVGAGTLLVGAGAGVKVRLHLN